MHKIVLSAVMPFPSSSLRVFQYQRTSVPINNKNVEHTMLPFSSILNKALVVKSQAMRVGTYLCVMTKQPLIVEKRNAEYITQFYKHESSVRKKQQICIICDNLDTGLKTYFHAINKRHIVNPVGFTRTDVNVNGFPIFTKHHNIVLNISSIIVQRALHKIYRNSITLKGYNIYEAH